MLYFASVIWTCDPPIRIPVLRRHQRALQFKLLRLNRPLGKSSDLGEGILWLSGVEDDMKTAARVHLYNGNTVKG